MIAKGFKSWELNSIESLLETLNTCHYSHQPGQHSGESTLEVVGMGCQMGNYLDIMEVYKYPIRESLPEVTEQKDSETKLKSLKLMVY